MTKPWYQSMTVVSAALYAVLQTLEQQAVIPSGALEAIVATAQNALLVLTAFGLRRALPGG